MLNEPRQRSFPPDQTRKVERSRKQKEKKKVVERYLLNKYDKVTIENILSTFITEFYTKSHIHLYKGQKKYSRKVAIYDSVNISVAIITTLIDETS